MRLGTIETHRPRGADAPRYASQQAAPALGSPQWVQKTFVHLFSPELLKSMRADEVVLPGAVQLKLHSARAGGYSAERFYKNITTDQTSCSGPVPFTLISVLKAFCSWSVH